MRRLPSFSTAYVALLSLSSVLFTADNVRIGKFVDGFPVESRRSNQRGGNSLSTTTNLRWAPFLVTHPSTCHRRIALGPIFSSRNDYRDDDEMEDVASRTKFVGGNQDEMELRRIKRVDPYPNKNRKDSYYEDDDDDYDDEAFTDYNDIGRTAGAPGAKLTRYRYEGEYDDQNGDDEFDDEEDEEPMAGNFWSNPTGGMDPAPPGFLEKALIKPRRVEVPRRRRDDGSDLEDEDDDDSFRQRRPRPRRPGVRRSPVRTGEPKPPRAILDFYDKLFWFGFDSSDNDDIGDKTVFGGTKGKFNGLAYLKASEGSSPSRNRNGSRNPPRRLPPARDRRSYAEVDYDDRDEEDRYDFSSRGDDDDIDDNGADLNRRSVESRKRRARRGRDEYKDSSIGSWVPKQVSDWFTPVEGDGYLDEESYDGSGRDRRRDSTSRRSKRRQQRRGDADSPWSPLTILDSFLGIDREEMAYKAGIYDSKMGVGSKRAGSRRQSQPPQRRSARDDPGRPGYAYRYDVDDDMDDSTPLVDIDPAMADEFNDTISGPTSEGRHKQPLTRDDDSQGRRSGRKEKTWEERAMAVERVPPADVVAWGPTGQLPMSARMKAIVDALQDIETARRKLDSRKKKESQAREDLTILNVDAERQRLKLEESRRSSRLDAERLRQIELDIDDASRALRKAKTQVEMARDELEEFQERHWAVLSFYNPEQASTLVGEALNEFSEHFQGAAPGKFSGERSEPNASDGKTVEAKYIPPDDSTSTNSS